MTGYFSPLTNQLLTGIGCFLLGHTIGFNATLRLLKTCSKCGKNYTDCICKPPYRVIQF